jgi:hypothetical protein
MLLGEVCFRELPYSAITLSAQTTRSASSDSADSQAQWLAPPTMWRISSDSASTYATRRTFGSHLAHMLGGVTLREIVLSHSKF